MTIQLKSPAGVSKIGLLEALRTDPKAVKFHNPSIFIAPSDPMHGDFTGEDVPMKEVFTVVLDHPKRSRFARVTKTSTGAWRVE